MLRPGAAGEFGAFRCWVSAGDGLIPLPWWLAGWLGSAKAVRRLHDCGRARWCRWIWSRSSAWIPHLSEPTPLAELLRIAGRNAVAVRDTSFIQRRSSDPLLPEDWRRLQYRRRYRAISLILGAPNLMVLSFTKRTGHLGPFCDCRGG
jgi:hypothetical protein